MLAGKAGRTKISSGSVAHGKNESAFSGEIPDGDDNQLMEQLVKTVKYPMGFLACISQDGEMCGETGFCCVDDKM